MVNKRTRNEANSIILAVLVIGIVLLINLIGLKKFARLDLTESRAYTLSESTRRLMGGLDDQILVKVYFTAGLPAPFSLNERYLRDLIADYAAYSNGRLRYEYHDPTNDEDLKSEAQGYGIQALEVTKIESDELGRQLAYMGLAIFYKDKMEAIPFVQSVDTLEYDLTGAIKRLTQEKKKRVGFLEGWGGGDPQNGLMPIKDVLTKNYQVQVAEIQPDHTIESDYDVVVVAGPKEALPEIDQWAIDQYLMKGGHVAFFVPQVQPNLQNFMGQPIDTGLTPMLASYGVKVKPDLVKDMQATIISVRSPGMPFPLPVKYPFIPMIGDFNADSVITKGLRSLPLAFVSTLELDDTLNNDRKINAVVLMRSSPNSWLQEGFFFLDPTKINPPESESELKSHPVAAALQGSFRSHFAEKGAPTPPPPTDEGTPVPEMPDTIGESASDARILVIGTDSPLSPQGQDDPAAVFVANAVDWLAADDDLIAIRSKSTAAPPLPEVGDGLKAGLKAANMFGLPALVVLLGLARWQWTGIRRKRIARQWSAAA